MQTMCPAIFINQGSTIFQNVLFEAKDKRDRLKDHGLTLDRGFIIKKQATQEFAFIAAKQIIEIY